MASAQYWIEQLGLERHPEGGYFRETYRSSVTFDQAAHASLTGPRAACTGIYFLLEGEDFSALHRLASDEMWHFYAGGTVLVHMIDAAGKRETLRIGAQPERGDMLQAVVPAGCLFGSCLEDANGFALVGCTVSPGFDFADFEMPDREELLRRYPQHGALVQKLTRG